VAEEWWHDPEIPDGVRRGMRYVDGILDGSIPSCEFTRLSCQRQYNEAKHGLEGYFFDCDAAQDVIDHIEGLKHTKGAWARKNLYLKLEDWQCYMLIVPFGWKTIDTKLRRFRTCYWEVARKNAKSTVAGGVANYLFTEDDEPGAEVYTCAVGRDQAKLVFGMARAQELKTRHTGVSVYTHHMSILDENHPSFGAIMKPLHSEDSSLDGLSTSAAINDELHAWGNAQRLVYDVIETSTGSREQPLIWNITTAGTNVEGVCYEQRSYLVKVLNGSLDDPTFCGCIWTIDKGDEEKAFTDETIWRKANPNFNVSVYPLDMQRLAKQAQAIPSKQSAFLTKRCNVWTNAAEAWMDMIQWAACGDSKLRLEDFRGQDCWIGTDLSSRRDLSAQGIVFRDTVGGKDHFYNFSRSYLPEKALQDPTNGGHYDGWHREGRLLTTPGATLDVDKIESDTCRKIADRHGIDPEGGESLDEMFNIRELPFDPMHNSTQFGVHMQAEGFICPEVRPTVINFSEPMKWMEAYVIDGTWHHDMNPVLTFAISNIVVHYDVKRNCFPRRESESRKIDPAIGSLMALMRALADEAPPIWDKDLLVV